MDFAILVRINAAAYWIAERRRRARPGSVAMGWTVTATVRLIARMWIAPVTQHVRPATMTGCAKAAAKIASAVRGTAVAPAARVARKGAAVTVSARAARRVVTVRSIARDFLDGDAQHRYPPA